MKIAKRSPFTNLAITHVHVECVVSAVVVSDGCASGDQTDTVHTSTTITAGRELTDMQRALQEGAVTTEEYERPRRETLRRPN